MEFELALKEYEDIFLFQTSMGRVLFHLMDYKEYRSIKYIMANYPEFKFDLRPIKDNGKVGSFKTKADKMVYDMKDEWVIVDIEELHNYLKKNQIKEVNLTELIDKLDWNIVLNKV